MDMIISFQGPNACHLPATFIGQEDSHCLFLKFFHVTECVSVHIVVSVMRFTQYVHVLDLCTIL